MVLKVSLGDDLRRIPVKEPASFSFSDLSATFRSMFTDQLPADFAVQYVDDEGDTIVVSSNGESLVLFVCWSVLKFSFLRSRTAGGLPRCL